jgi:RHS repeat-associated protein
VTGGVKESLVLASAAAGSTFAFHVSLNGVTARVAADGSVEFVDSSGTVTARMPVGFMRDSKFNRASGGFTESSGVSYSVTSLSAAGFTLTVSLDSTWLADRARVWPVTVDPSLNNNPTDHTYVLNDNSTDRSSDPELLIGTWNGGGETALSFLHFNNFYSTYQGDKLTGASMNLFDTWSFNCNAAVFWINPVSSAWTAHGLTWSTRPSYGSAIGSANVAPGAACTNTSGNPAVGTWMAANIGANNLQNWALNSSNNGLAITASLTDNSQWKRFDSPNASVNHPYLAIWYTPDVIPQVNQQYPASGYASPTLTPQLWASATDQDGWPSSLTYDFSVCQVTTTGCSSVADSGAQAGQSWTVTPALQWGKQYLWTVTANDGAWPSVSQTQNYFTTTVPQPLVTSALSQNQGNGFEPSIGNYTTSATDASVASVGPAVSVVRDYNSADPRRSEAFGAGWSSLVDAKATEVPASTPTTVVVTYPSGQDVAFGRNTNGTFSAPSGRYATLTSVSGGYSLVDKQGTTFAFTTATGTTGVFGLTSVTDANGRTMTLSYTSGEVVTATSASGRALHLTWSTPTGASAPHVSTVTTDRANPSDPSTAYTWSYGYTGDALTSVCPPTSPTQCYGYSYTTGSSYPMVVRNAAAHSYWRLGEASGTAAKSAVVDNMGLDNGTYSNVTLGVPGPFQPGATATATGFNGTSSSVSLPSGTGNMPYDTPYQSVSLWFKTTTPGGVLLGQSVDPITAASTQSAYTPVLYIGSDGRLRGQVPTAPAPGGTPSVLQGAASGLCVDTQGGAFGNGAPVQLNTCSATASQQWTYTSSQQLTITNGTTTQCLDATGLGTVDGTPLQTWSCTGATNQKWTMNANGWIVGVGSTRCVDPTGHTTTVGTPLELLACATSVDPNQAFFPTVHTPMASTATVTDGAWHHVVLTAAAGTQTLYLDGSSVGTPINGPVVGDLDAANEYLGAGFVGGGWPSQGHSSSTVNTGYPSFFTGSIGEVAVFDQTLTGPQVTALYQAGAKTASLLSSVTRPSGNPSAQVQYDPTGATLTQLTDTNGGVWQVGAPTVSGSAQVYASSVLGPGPADYWRLAETGTSTAINQVHGNAATYNNVTLGATPGPFAGTLVNPPTVASFDGSTSYLQLPAQDTPSTGPLSVSLWFNMPQNSTAGGVLFGTQNQSLANSSSATNWTPALYVDTAGKLRGGLWVGSQVLLVSPNSVNDGQWHHAVLAVDPNASTRQVLYLDGVAVASSSTALVAVGASYAYVGSGKWSGWAATPTGSVVGYFPGKIAEVALYRSQLAATDVATQYAARRMTSAPVTTIGVPQKTITVTDPGSNSIAYVYDVTTGREVAQAETLVSTNTTNTTQYGYDTGGFLRTVTDPNGNVTTTLQDGRGNTTSKITCQNQAQNLCTTESYTYYLNQNSSTDVRNDLPLSSTDGNTNTTTYAYDTAGNQTTVTDPLGRVRTTAYTGTNTDVAADSTGSPVLYAPPGLPKTMTTPGGAVQTNTYNHTGDLAKVIDAAGKETDYGYDGLGRIVTQTEKTDTFPSGLATAYTYDSVNRVLTTTDPAVTDRVTGAVHTPKTTIVYTVDGRVLSTTVADLTGGDASRVTSSMYNTHNQADSTTDAANKVTHYTYDAYGNVASQTDPDGNQILTVYDLNAHLLTTTLHNYTGDPNNPQAPADKVLSTSTYDPAGRLAQVTDAMGWQTNYTYTDNNLVATITRVDPSSGASFVTETDSYDHAGNLTSKATNNRVTTANYGRDAANRIITTTVDPSGANRTTTTLYSPDDYVTATKVADSAGAWSHGDATYDPLGRLTSQTSYTATGTYPLGWWKLGESGGTTASDWSGNEANGTWTGASSWSPNGAAVFNGSNDQIATSRTVVNTTSSFTVSAWANLTLGSVNETLVSQDGTNISGFYLEYEAVYNKWALTMGDGDSTSTLLHLAESTAAPTGGVWTHLVGVFNASTKTMTLYVNGVANGTATLNSTWNAGGVLRIGRGTWGGGPVDLVNGQVSNVQVYQRALAASDVSTLYNHGRLGAPISTDQLTTSYTVDHGGLATSMTDPNGNQTGYTYDEAQRLAVTTAPTVPTETNGGTPVNTHPVAYTGYDTFGEKVEVKDPDGNITTTAYDADGRVSTTTLPTYTPPGSQTPITPQTSRGYDNDGRLISSTDALNHTTNYVNDQLGRVATVTDPNSGVTTATYDLLGDQLSTTDPTGAQNQATYDYLGRKLTTSAVVRQDSATDTTHYAYDTTDPWLHTVTSPANVVTTYGYNNVGDVTSKTDGASNTTQYKYTGTDKLATTTYPDNTYATTSYDLAGRVVGVAQYDASHNQLTRLINGYDGDSNLTSATQPDGTTTTQYAYTATNWPASEIQPISATDSITTSFGYDPAGNQTRSSDGRGNPFITTYNVWNLPESQIEPATTAHPNAVDRTFTTAYDAAGRVASISSPGGVSVTDTYDVLNRVTLLHGAGADAPTTDRSFGYDAAGRVTSAVTGVVSDTFTYDDRGLLRTTAGSSGATTLTYTADGLPQSRVDAAGTTGYTYDAADRPATVTNTGVNVVVGYQYNVVSQPNLLTYNTTGDTRTLSYDSLHRLTGDQLKTSTGTSVATIGYGYDTNSNETSKTTTGFAGAASNSYTYDQANRLLSWNNGTTTTTYAYDKSGNRIQAGTDVYGYDQRDELLTSENGATSYTYTPRGTLATQVGSATLTTTADAFGQVATQTPSAGGTANSYTYDALGRVLQTGFAYTGTGNTLATDGVATYTRDSSDSLAAVTASGSTRLTWTDQHTDQVAQFTPTATALSGSTSYDPLGRVLATTSMAGNLGYQSEYTDSTTGRANMDARWYNTNTGQFDTRDSATNSPVPSSAAANRYAYAGDNPLTGTDPTGHSLKYLSEADPYTTLADTQELARFNNRANSAASIYQENQAEIARFRAREAMADPSYNPDDHQALACEDPRTKHSNSCVGGRMPNCADITRGDNGEFCVDDHGTVAVIPGYRSGDQYQAGDGQLSWAEYVFLTGSSDLEAAIHQYSAADLKKYDHDAYNELYTLYHEWFCRYNADTCAKQVADEWDQTWKGILGVTDAMNCYHFVRRQAGGDWVGCGMTVVNAIADFSIVGKAAEVTVEAARAARVARYARKLGGIDEGIDSLDNTLNDSRLGGSCLNSFTPSTPVLMANGTTKPIGDITIGDSVTTTDPTTGVTSGEPVTLLHLNADHELTDITVNTGTSTEKSLRTTGTSQHLQPATGGPAIATAVIHTTANHPFWDNTGRTWTDASDLAVGRSTLRDSNGHDHIVLAVHNYSAERYMRNLTVANTHTYYVMAGNTPVLVHNTSPTGCYVWAKPNVDTSILEPGEAWDPSQGTPIIGRLPDTRATTGWPGYTHLDLGSRWTIAKNDAWIQTIIDQRGSVYVGSPPEGNYWSTVEREPTTFAREQQQLLQAGYIWDGDYLVPGP